MLHGVGEEKLHFRENIVKQKLAYAGHVPSGFNSLLVLEGKFNGKRMRGQHRRTWIGDIIQWMQNKKYDEV